MAGIVEKLQKMWNPPDDEYDEYYEDEATEPTADSREEQPSARRSFSSSSSNRVVNINHARAGAQVVVFKPNSFRDDTNSIADEINQGHTVKRRTRARRAIFWRSSAALLTRTTAR